MDGIKSVADVVGLRNEWDVIVVGAGPAGGVAATMLARRGLRVLLVEAKRFPRTKVCGGCLSARGVELLRRVGLDDVLRSPSFAPLEEVQLLRPRRGVTIAMPGGLAIFRSEFDDRLARMAVESGARFLDETTAVVLAKIDGARRLVELKSHGQTLGTAYARLVLACDGLVGGATSALRDVRQTVARTSRIGLGAVMADDDEIPDAAIVMAIGRRGYVGRARLGDGRICLGAAVDAVAVRRCGPWGVIREILVESGSSAQVTAVPCEIHGTAPLTRQPRSAAAERVFLLGDACGYVEPFTGQGMAVALETATAVVPFVEAALATWSPDLNASWTRTVAAITGHRNTFCRGLAFASRRPWLADAAFASIARTPRLFAALLARMNRLPTTVRA